MKKLLYGVVALTFTSVALARTNVPYPTEKMAEFVVDKLDVTTLPSAIRPKHEKAKKTFSDYSYVASQLGDKEAILETRPSGQQIDIKVLQQESAGIYVCLTGLESNANKEHIRISKAWQSDFISCATSGWPFGAPTQKCIFGMVYSAN